MKHTNKLKSSAKNKLAQLEAEMSAGPTDSRDEEFYNRLSKEKSGIENALKVSGNKKRSKNLKSALGEN
jgi:hypothetical protein